MKLRKVNQDQTENQPRVMIVSRCAWTPVTYRGGQIRYLISRGVEVYAAVWEADGYANQIEGTGAIFHHIPISLSPTSRIRDLMLIWRLSRTYKKVGPDIIHQFTIKPVIYGSLAARIAGVTSVVNTITGLGYAFTTAPGFFSLLVSFPYRQSLRWSSKVFFQNDDDRRVFVDRKLVNSKSIEVVAGCRSVYVKMQMSSFCVFSDSGTITEKASFLNLPAITIRNAHERPECMDEGTVAMSGLGRERVLDAVRLVTSQHSRESKAIPFIADYDAGPYPNKLCGSYSATSTT